MGKVSKLRYVFARPLFVLAVSLLCVYFATYTPHLALQPQTVSIPKIIGLDYALVTQAAMPQAALGAQFHIVIPTTPNTALNEVVKTYIDQQVTAFISVLPNIPANDGFLHQLRIFPKIDYVSNSAISLTLEIDEYHPIHEVTMRFVSWQADASGVKQEVLSQKVADQLKSALGVNKNISDQVNQPFAFGLLPNHDIRVYNAGFLTGDASQPYKDLDLNSMRILATKYHNTFYSTYEVVLPPAAKQGLKMQYARALAKDINKMTDCSLQSCIALTFDDGPDFATTPKVLDILKDKNVKATFFELGNLVKKNPQITQRVLAEGHEVENHSYAHPDFVKLKQPAAMRKEIDTAQTALIAAGAVPKFFRPPYGSVNDAVRTTVNMPLVFWNVDPQEWRTGNDALSVAHSILSQARPGAIILMHDTKPLTANALPMVIDILKQRGYKFVKVQDLLQIDGNARGDFRSK